MFRLSKKPAKQLLYLFLWRDLRLTRGLALGVDAGCGDMQNKPWFASQRYLGIDLDAERLAAAQARHPDSEILCLALQDVANIEGDFVLCIQVMNNRFFAVDDTMAACRALVAMVRPGGELVFNLSKRALAFEAEIDALLADNFSDVHKAKSGTLSALETMLSPLLAGVMYFFPLLRRGVGYEKIYYRCQGRK
ncbi:MAG TPA: methyltransferase domain-containing protein [Alphaproteobacteria bacterium]|nr:methyltransferase domain-containing protein [Alphaproteobacteria bacterium]